MANLVGVFGTSHSPALIAPVSDWPALEPNIPRPSLDHLVGNVRDYWDEHVGLGRQDGGA